MSVNYGRFWDFLYFVGVITILCSYILITKVQGKETFKLWPLTVSAACIIVALRCKYRTSGSCSSEKAKKSLPGNACVLDSYNCCTLNRITLWPSYCGNPEQYILGVALNRTTVWRASEVQKELLKLLLISGYICMIFLIKIYPSQHFLTKIILYIACCKPRI